MNAFAVRGFACKYKNAQGWVWAQQKYMRTESATARKRENDRLRGKQTPRKQVVMRQRLKLVSMQNISEKPQGASPRLSKSIDLMLSNYFDTC